MASVDKSSDAVDNHATDPSSSCLNDPNYAIICVFLQKFGSQLKIEHPNFLRLQKMIENTDEVHDELRLFYVKLLRKIRKSVQPDKLDSALAKFCYTYSAHDAWEVERFGYKQASLPVKLRILKELLECQFDKNPNFRSLISSQTATELRSQPLGKDRLGNAYWSTIDDQCNLRIYQEHLDEEIWKVVATNRDEMVKLISCLRGNELVMPSLIGLIDEDSSSNSMPAKVDALESENGTANGTTNGNANGNANANANGNDSDDKNVPCLKIKLNPSGGESTVEQISNSDNTNGAKTQSQNSVAEEEEEEEEEEDASVMSEIDELSVAASESSTTTAGTKSNETHGSKRISLMASKPPSNANKLKLRIFATDKKSMKRNLEVDSDTASSKNKRQSMRKGTEDDDSEFDSEEYTDEELDENDMSGDDEVGPAIEEPTLYVQGSGSGAANQCEQMLWPDCDEFETNEVSDAIEEDVFYVCGEGSGHDCDVGNNDIKTTETSASSTTAQPQPLVQSKPMFFFGQAGCLKLSPMKPAVASDNLADSPNKNDNAESDDCEQVEHEKVESDKLQNENIESEKNDNDNESENAKNQEPSTVVKETTSNDTNSVALDAKSESVEGNATSNDEIDRGVSISNESPVVDAPLNNVEEKIQQNTSSNDLKISEITMQCETNDSNVTLEVEKVTESITVEGELATTTAISNVNADYDSSKDNIESNSSVALESVSVQEECNEKSVEQESPSIDSEVLAKPDYHSNEKESEISDNFNEEQSEPQNQVNTAKELDKPEESTSNENSEIVNETNVLEIENQSSLSQEEQPNAECEQIDVSSSKVVPIENQDIDSSKNDELPNPANEVTESKIPVESSTNEIANKESNEPNYSDQEPVIEVAIVPKKAYICGPEEAEIANITNVEPLTADVSVAEEALQIEPQIEDQLEQPVENEASNEGDNLSNSEEKTESLSEQVMNEKSTREENAVECSLPIEPSTTDEPESEETHLQSDDPLSIPLEESNSPEQNENTDQEALAPAEEPIVEQNQEPIIEPTDLPAEQKIPEQETERTESTDFTEEYTEQVSDDTVESELNKSETVAVEPVESRLVVNQQHEAELAQESSNSIEPSENIVQAEATVSPLETAENVINEEIEEQTEHPKEDLVIPVPKLPSDETKILQSTSQIPQEEPEKDQIEIKLPETIPAPVSEKRKSFDDVEQASECKKVCEENIAVDVQPIVPIESNLTIEEVKPSESVESENAIDIQKKPNEKEVSQPETIKPLENKSAEICDEKETVTALNADIVYSQVERSKHNEPIVPAENIALETIVAPAQAILNKKASETVESGSLIQKELNTSKVESVKVTEEPTIETPTRKSARQAASKSNDTESIAPPSNVEASRGVQLRNRKRRISTEKIRHTSESDDNVDTLIESPLSQQDASSDEEVGGKRIKMRPKVVKRTLRKSVEQKRNIKDTDWSSDENDKPNAKRATSELPKGEQEVKIEPVTEKVTPDENKKPEVKDENLVAEQQEHVAVEDAKVKEEEQQSDEEKATPTRRGRPARRGRKPGPKPKPKLTPEVKTEKVKEEKPEPEAVEQTEPKKEEKSTPGTRRKKRSLLGLDMADVETIQAAADDTPVRQSRRIAQIKIKEEAERRKAEEVALLSMKEASEKKKKGVVMKQSESEEENSESEAKLEKKKRHKKGNKDKPWQTDSDDSSERDEEEVYEHEDVERLPPLRSDHEFSPESDIEDESQIVPTKRARTARKDKTERREESSEEEEDIHACQKCTKNDHPEWILLCDKCDKGYHCSCLIPVLFVIPEGNWFCPPCQQEKLIDTLEGKLIEFDGLVKQKEIEEAQRERLLLTTISEANVIQDSKRDQQRARAARGLGDSDDSSDGSSSDDSENDEKPINQDRRTRPRPRHRHISESSDQSSSDNSSDNEPIYKLRKRRQANVSYRFNEYDELINRAIKSEMDEVAGAGNLGRGKDISTIMEADKEEKRLKKLEQDQKDRELAGDTNEKDNDDSDDQPLKTTKADNSDDSDSEPIRPKVVKRNKNLGKKKKKLNSLDVDSEEDVDSSDDDFKGGDSSDEEEEDDSTPDSESSLDSIVRRKGKNRRISTRRSVRERKKRYDNDFIDDSSFDDEDNKPLVKKKKKVESDFSDFDGSSEEIDEDVDSDDLCDDSTDESDKSWGKRKKKPASKGKEIQNRKKKPDGERSLKGKTAKKKPKVSDDDDDDDDNESDDEYADEVLPKSRRTRGKKLPYLLDDDFDSSDDGIKPGVKRPDTPPEERAAFIKKQEEIKRMLAEKRDEPVDKIPPPVKGSLSTIPPQIIQSAKALDVDLKKTTISNRNASDNDSNGFDDDLPEDFDPEDMDEDAIERMTAKMMEEEEFAQHQLKLAGESIRNRKLKDALTDPMKKDDSPTKLTIETSPSVIMPPNIPPSLVSPLPIVAPSQLAIPDIPASMYTAQFQGAHSKMATPKKRGRKTKDDLPLILGAKDPVPPQTQSQSQLSTILHTSIAPPTNKPNTLLNIPSVLQTPPSQLFSSSTIQHTASVIAHSSVIQQQQATQQHQRILPPMPSNAMSSILGLGQNREQIIPSTVLDVQNTRLLDPSELGKPPDDLLDPAAKKRARRKKVTPTRESLITSPPNAIVSPGISQPVPVTIPNIPNVSKPPTSILSERLSANPVEKPGLSIATPPQLYSPSSRTQASVITRLSRPSQRQPFPSGQSSPQRYYAPNTVPPHSIPTTGSHSRPYHAPNVTVASGPRPPPLVPPPHTSGHLPHPMYMRGQPGIYGGYPNIQPPPMHRSLQSIEHASNAPQNFTGPYQNIPFGSYYAAAAAAERRSGAIIGTFEPFDNKNPSSHDRLPAYAHPGLGLAALASRNLAGAGGDDERSAPHGSPHSVVHGPPHGPPHGPGGSTGGSEFSGLVSYFSSQQDDLDS